MRPSLLFLIGYWGNSISCSVLWSHKYQIHLIFIRYQGASDYNIIQKIILLTPHTCRLVILFTFLFGWLSWDCVFLPPLLQFYWKMVSNYVKHSFTFILTRIWLISNFIQTHILGFKIESLRKPYKCTGLKCSRCTSFPACSHMQFILKNRASPSLPSLSDSTLMSPCAE